MGAEQSRPQHKHVKGDGIPFIKWNDQLHFAEPSSYRYSPVREYVSGDVVFADPPKADAELRNEAELSGKIAIIERGGRVHFPDVMRRIFAAGVVGCIFIESELSTKPRSTFDGFHSSGHQKISIPILRLSKHHADALLQDQPARVHIRMLHAQDAIQHLECIDTEDAIVVASRSGEVQVLKHLLQHCVNSSTIPIEASAYAYCEAVEGNHIDCLELLHEADLPINAQKPNGTSPLMVACSINNIEATRALVMYGAKLDLEDAHGMNALMIAARNGSSSCLKFLIRKGALVHLSRNRTKGTTALHIAAQRGAEECVEILINAGSAVDIESLNSSTALMEAARSGHLGCVRLLVEADANLDLKDREGNTAEKLAHDAGHERVEDFLRSRYNNDTLNIQRRSVQYISSQDDFKLRDLLNGIEIDVLEREVLRNAKVAVLIQQNSVVYDVFRTMITPPKPTDETDPVYGPYKMNYFCCEIALWYERKVFEVSGSSTHAIDRPRCFGYLNVLFSFIKQTGTLDDVVLVLFSKVISSFVIRRQFGPILLEYLAASDGKDVVPWLARQIGYDSIRDILLWLLYSDLSTLGQENIAKCDIFQHLFSRLSTWQRTLSWGVGTAYQRDSIENISTLLSYIVYPPAISVVGEIITFVENVDNTLPLITDQARVGTHNNLLKTLLEQFTATDNVYGSFIDLGLSELTRQFELDDSKNVIFEGGALAIVLMLMSTLGYHKIKRDLSSVESLLRDAKKALIQEIVPRVLPFVQLCSRIVANDTPRASKPKRQILKGNALLSIVTFLKRSVLMQSALIDHELAKAGCMPILLASYDSHPNNSLLHHELTDVIRFILLDPAQTRLPSCPLLNSLFMERSNLLEFVMTSYRIETQYRGHMTTVANSILTLTNTPVCKLTVSSKTVTVQDVVRQYTLANPRWKAFEKVLADQNRIERQPLGQRNAPLCDGCLSLKESALAYVVATLDADIPITGYLETLFKGSASHRCKVNTTNDFITGYVYKKDKKHDHIPIPEPTRVSSFIQFPVPMPFHALTFTITYVGICQRCGKLWYCDTLNAPNWSTRMKWVVPTSVRKWYSFGTTEGPGSGAHGFQFSTRGYKTFLVITDTWGRQEQWIRAIERSIVGASRQSSQSINWESALAIEIDNETETETDDPVKKARSKTEDVGDKESSGVMLAQFPKPAPRTAFQQHGKKMSLGDIKLPSMESNGIRHVVSTPDLQTLKQRFASE